MRKLYPVTQSITAIPRVSVMMRRLLPSLTQSIGLGSVYSPPGGAEYAGSEHAESDEVQLLDLRSASSSFRQVKLVPHTCCVPIAQSPPAGHAAVKAQFLRQQCCADLIVFVTRHAASNADQVFDGDMVLLAATNAGLSPSPRAAWAMP